MPTDIDRLHDFIENKDIAWYSRNSGKSIYQIHILAHQIQLGDSMTVIARINRSQDRYYLSPMIFEIFKEQGIEIKSNSVDRSRWIVEYEGKKTELLLIPDGENDRFLGMRHALVVSLVDYSLDKRRKLYYTEKEELKKSYNRRINDWKEW